MPLIFRPIIFGSLLMMSVLVFGAHAAADESALPKSSDLVTEENQEEFEDSDDREALQKQPGATRTHFGPEHRKELYHAQRLQTRRALLYSALLPGLGNFYVEQYALGTVAFSAFIFSAMFLGYGFVNNQSDIVRIGAVLAILTYGGAATSSYLGVRSYNDRLRRRLHLGAHHSPAFSEWHSGPHSAPIPAPVFGVSWQWRF